MASSGFAVQQQNSPTKPAAAFGGAPSFGGNIGKYFVLS